VRGYIRVRRGPEGTTYQLAVYAGLDAKRRRRYRYETVRGSRRDAEHRLAELLGEAAAGQVGSTRTVRFAELVEAWWEASTRDLSPNTRIGYRGILDRYLLPTFGHRRADRITPAELERWYAQLLDGKARAAPRPLSAQTIRKVHHLMSSILSTAVRWGWLTANPAERTRPPRAKAAVVNPPEPGDVERALHAAQLVSDELHVFLWLSVALGTRRSETCALRWDDIDLEFGTVAVRHSLALDDRDPRQVLERDTKTHASATLPVDAETIALLKRFRTASLRRALASGGPIARLAYLFSPEPDGSLPRHPDHFSKAWSRLRAPLRLEGVRLHDLRHFHGTELASAGIPMTAIRDRLRHTNLRTTSIYAHSRRDVDRAAAEAIGRVLPRLSREPSRAEDADNA
jgi:integrase